MELFEEFISNIWVVRIFWSIITILISILIYSIIARFADTHEKKKGPIPRTKKGRTFAKMFKSIVRYVLIILDVLIILQIFGVDVSSTLAGVGVIGIVVAFAIQDALKDIVRGFDIISDNYYRVGDIVKIGATEGKVLSVGLKTTKIQDITTNNTVSIANRNIVEAEVLSGYVYIPVPLPYELKTSEAKKVLDEAVLELQEKPNINSAAYQGVSNFSESSLDHQIVITCDPATYKQSRRDALLIIMSVLDKHKISIPYPHLDLKSSK